MGLVRVSDDAVIETMGMVGIENQTDGTLVRYDGGGKVYLYKMSLDELLTRLLSVGYDFTDARPKGKP